MSEDSKHQRGGVSSNWVAAFQAAQHHTAQAHIAYQQAMSQAHVAYLQAAQSTFNGLAQAHGLPAEQATFSQPAPVAAPSSLMHILRCRLQQLVFFKRLLELLLSLGQLFSQKRHHPPLSKRPEKSLQQYLFHRRALSLYLPTSRPFF